MGGEQGTEGVTLVTGIHAREEVGSGFVMGAGLFGDPVHAQAVAQASEHAHKKHGARFAHPAQVVEVADIQTLMESAFNSPGQPVELEPIQGAEMLRRTAGEQFHRVGLFAVGDADEAGGLGNKGKVGAFSAQRGASQSSDFVPTFV